MQRHVGFLGCRCQKDRKSWKKHRWSIEHDLNSAFEQKKIRNLYSGYQYAIYKQNDTRSYQDDTRDTAIKDPFLPGPLYRLWPFP